MLLYLFLRSLVCCCRQGDPGDTHLVLSFDDPQLRLSNEAAAKAAQGPFGEHAPHGLALKVLP